MSAASPSATTPLLATVDLGCRRGERWLFQGLALRLHAGEVVWLRGANGRGKTSLLRLLAGLSAPAAGEIRWRGLALRTAGAAWREALVYIGHANGLKDDLTVNEALAFLACIHGRPAGAAVLADALRTVGMHGRRSAPVRSLSQGQRRRVALARLALDLATASGADASTWLLDEPYDALDTDGCAMLDALIAAQAKRGGAVLLTSHLPLALRDPSPRELALDENAPPARPRRDPALAVA